MSEQDNSGMPMPKHGTYCWTEIASGDAAKSIDFFTKIFGWKFADSTVSDDTFKYHEYSTEGDHPTGGLYTLSPEMFGGGEVPPPHFMSYIAVDDVDETAKKAVELGGKVLKEPDNIPNTGRFAVLQEPTGAVFAIFKPGV